MIHSTSSWTLALQVGFAKPSKECRRLATPIRAQDGTGIARSDPGLLEYQDQLRQRWNHYNGMKQHIEANEGSLAEFARKSYKKYGLHRREGGVEVC